jgi:hypothetical protein
LDIRKTGKAVATIEIILGLSAGKPAALWVTIVPSDDIVVEVVCMLPVNIVKEKTVNRENKKQIRGIIRPRPLFFVLERNI